VHKATPSQPTTTLPKPTCNPPTPRHLPYLSNFEVWLPPLLPFDPTSTECKLHSMRSAFGSLYCHLWNCDPTARIGRPADSWYQPIGPESTLQAYPNNLNRVGFYLEGLKPHPDGSHTQCFITIQHSLKPTLFLERLNGPDRFEKRHYMVRRLWTKQPPQTKLRPSKRKRRKKRKPPKDPTLVPSPVMKTLISPSVLKTLAHFWAASKTLPPTTCLAPLKPHPPVVQWLPTVHIRSRQHSATGKTNLGLPWLLAVLERQWTTSWDLVLAGRFWPMAGV
jgi:hypothetical protein